MNKHQKQKTRLKSKIILLASVFIGFQSFSQTLDLETCLKMADTANLSLKNARLDIASNQSQISAYKASLLPKVNFNGDYRYYPVIPGNLFPAEFSGGKPGTYTVVQFGVPYNFSNTIQLNQTIYNPLLNSGLNSLKVNQKIVELQGKLTSQNTQYQVYQTFFNLQAISKQLSFIESNLKNTDKLIANVNAFINQKMMLSVEADKLNVNRLNLVNQQQKLNSTKDQLEYLLKILIGMDASEKIELVAEGLIEKSIVIDKAERQNTELEIINAQKELNQLEKSGLKMAYLPTFSFYAAYNYGYNMRPETNFSKGINSSFIGVRIDWTLFDGFEKHNKAKVNRIQSEKLNNQLELIDQQLAMTSENSKKQVEIQINSLMIAKEQLALSEKIYKQVEASFKEGIVSSNDIIKAENDLNQSQTNVISTYVQLRQAELDLLKSTGNLK
jgi:outer membrane protein TolC